MGNNLLTSQTSEEFLCNVFKILQQLILRKAELAYLLRCYRAYATFTLSIIESTIEILVFVSGEKVSRDEHVLRSISLFFIYS